MDPAESPVQLLGTLLDSLPVVTAHYLLQRDLRLKFFRDAVRQEKEVQAHRLTEEALNAWRIPLPADAFGELVESRDEALGRLADVTRLPINWSMPWRPAIELPWEFPVEISRAVVAGWMQQKLEDKARRSLSARKAAETRKRRRAIADGTQREAGMIGGSADDGDNSAGSSDDRSSDECHAESVG